MLKKNISTSLLQITILFFISCHNSNTTAIAELASKEGINTSIPPETNDLTLKAIVGKWKCETATEVSLLNFKYYDMPVYSEEQRYGEEHGTRYANPDPESKVEGAPKKKPIGTVKKLQAEYQQTIKVTSSSSQFRPTNYIDVLSPGIISCEFDKSEIYIFNIKFSSYNRIVLNEKFIFNRIE
jgi:hypothetical protein